MANTKTYIVTKKYADLCHDLEGEAMATIGLKFPNTDISEVEVICPPIAVYDVGDPFADPGDYDDKDVPKLDKMVELGLLESTG